MTAATTSRDESRTARRGEHRRAAGESAPVQPSPLLFDLFARRYVPWYLRRSFHAVRLRGGAPAVDPRRPVVVCMTHPAWWDPLVGMFLAGRIFGLRMHFAPIDAAMLAKYGFFRRLGMFGIAPGHRGAATFLRVAPTLLRRPGATLWVTAQGTFVDPRVRPLVLRAGIGHVLRRVPDAVCVPLALEYAYWQEKRAEVLLRFGAAVQGDADATAGALTERVTAALTAAANDLAAAAAARDAAAFTTLLTGQRGVSAVYDAWRLVKARVRGRLFDPGHGAQP